MTEERVLLAQGDTAPDFTLLNQKAEEVSLASFRGAGLIIFFYPAAMTQGCTKEACDFRDSLEPLRAAGYEIVGISPDTPEKLAKFVARDSLTYDLLSDTDKAVLNAYGAFGDKSLYGKITRGVIRSTVILDAEGTVEHALYNVKATGHVGRIRKLLGIDPK